MGRDPTSWIASCLISVCCVPFLAFPLLLPFLCSRPTCSLVGFVGVHLIVVRPRCFGPSAPFGLFRGTTGLFPTVIVCLTLLRGVPEVPVAAVFAPLASAFGPCSAQCGSRKSRLLCPRVVWLLCLFVSCLPTSRPCWLDLVGKSNCLPRAAREGLSCCFDCAGYLDLCMRSAASP